MYVVNAKEPTIVHRWTKQAIVVKDALRIGPISIYIYILPVLLYILNESNVMHAFHQLIW